MFSKLAHAVMTGNIMEIPTFEIYEHGTFIADEGAKVVFTGPEKSCVEEFATMNQKAYNMRRNGQHLVSLNNAKLKK